MVIAGARRHEMQNRESLAKDIQTAEEKLKNTQVKPEEKPESKTGKILRQVALFLTFALIIGVVVMAIINR